MTTQDSKDWLDELLYRFADYVRHHDRTGLGGKDNQHTIKAAIELHYAKELEKADTRETKALEERDVLEDKLDSLSEAVAAYFKVDIGEHSNVNDPVYNAYQLLRDNTRIDQINRERD